MVSYVTRGVKFELVGTLEGHKGWVTQIATTRVNEDVILSSSRDKTIIVWRINPSGTKFGYAKKALRGHGHFVSDVVFSSDSQFALSSSWDHTLRLWDLNEGRTTRKFADHKKDVLSVSFSSDNRQIVSSSRDNTIKLWNTLGQCKYTISEDCNDWISCVRFSPDPQLPIIVSCGWDKLVKVWNLKNCRLKVSHHGHTGYLNTVAVSPDGSLCASGGRDGHAMLWDLTKNKFVHSLETIDTINALCFSPKKYWLCVAGGSSIKVYDLEQHTQIYDDLKPAATINDLNKQDETEKVPDHDFKAECTCLAWSQSGMYLYAGYTDGIIRVWQVNE